MSPPDTAEIAERLARVQERVAAAPGLAGACALSVGMGSDAPLATTAGSTTARIGSAVFGPRHG